MNDPTEETNGTPPTSVTLERIGEVLAGKYRLEQILGTGGMGVVFSATHLQLQDRVAIKLLLPDALKSDELRSRFLREARVTARLRSEHIARVMDAGMLDSGAPYMVMEYLFGQDLRHVLTTEGSLPLGRAVDYTLQACSGIAVAHEAGVIHRDLKPANLFLTRRDNGTELIKILDFGVSKVAFLADADQELTTVGRVLGSPKFMSPEQVKSSDDVDERADVWSLGVILYTMLAGRPPFAGRTPGETVAQVLGWDPPPPLSSFRNDVPAELEAAIGRAMERDRTRRTPSVVAFSDDITQAIGLGALYSRAPRADSAPPPESRSASFSASSTGALVAAIDRAPADAIGDPFRTPRGRSWVSIALVAVLCFVLGGSLLLGVSAPRADDTAARGETLPRAPARAAASDDDARAAARPTYAEAPTVDGPSAEKTPPVEAPAPSRVPSATAPTPPPIRARSKPREPAATVPPRAVEPEAPHSDVAASRAASAAAPAKKRDPLSDRL